MEYLKFKLINKTYLLNIIIIVLLVFILKSCIYSLYNTVTVEEDDVKGSRRIKKKVYYRNDIEFYTPFYSLNQIIVKEIKASGTTYTVYDQLRMRSDAFALEDTIYILTDNKIIPIQIENKELDKSFNISENTKKILTADSTKLTVVTGYEKSEYKSSKITYHLNEFTLTAIRQTEELKFRYYSGPDMMTTKMPKSDLKDVKEIIDMQ